MDVTEVRIRLVKDRNAEKLRAFVTLTFDGEFVVRDVKIIDGNNSLFVAMPSRKITERCPKCGAKNMLRSNFCIDCGARMPKDNRENREPEASRSKLHVDVAHPITPECRQRIHEAVMAAYDQAVERSRHEENSFEEYVFSQALQKSPLD